MPAIAEPDGSAGEIEIAATRIEADDFAFGMSGSVYITTHPEHTLVRLDRSSVRTKWQAPTGVGSAAPPAPSEEPPGDEKALHITTDGGFLIPRESGIQGGESADGGQRIGLAPAQGI